MGMTRGAADGVPDTTGARYSAGAVALHWVIAAVIGLQLALGWWMNEFTRDHSPQQDAIQSWHVSLGLTLLILVALRVVWRLTHRPPPLVSGMAGWERNLATFVHISLYVLMLAQPVGGWALMSSRGEALSFWGLPFPALPGIPPHNRGVGGALKHLHIFWLVWAYVIALFLHVGGAIKHQLGGHPVLWRMVPSMRAPT